jgi:hypothetical protein
MLAALPIARRWTSPGIFTALIIGSMIPDWPLYIPVGPAYQLTHSFPGIFIACLPLGLALTLLFLAVVRRALFELAPPGLQRRLASILDGPPDLTARAIAALALAVCVGAMTHIVWDAFTHRGAWGVALVPALQQSWFSITGVQIAGYMVLQHGCSLIGLPLLAVLYVKWYRRAEQRTVAEPVISGTARGVWLALLFGFPLLAMIRHIAVIPLPGLRPVAMALFYGVTEAGFLLFILIACYSLLFYPVARYLRKNISSG